MILFKKSIELRKYLETQRTINKRVGFVPTMGALHPGHMSLMNSSRQSNDLTVCSIFVNPTQFNDPNDFEKYPVTLEKDISMLLEAEVDLLFLPSKVEMYPKGSAPSPSYELDFLETVLEGTYRPGHFQGVCEIVDKLLNIVFPDNLYIGQKDFQQCMVIKKLVSLLNMQDQTTVHICPTLREPDGLAMSSRNLRLTTEERLKAPALYNTLQFVKEKINSASPSELKRTAIEQLEQSGFRMDYIEIAGFDNLKPVEKWDGKQELVVLVAAYLNEIRLIDNIIIKPQPI